MCSSGELGKQAGQLPGTGPPSPGTAVLSSQEGSGSMGLGKLRLPSTATLHTTSEDSGSRLVADHLGSSLPSP